MPLVRAEPSATTCSYQPAPHQNLGMHLTLSYPRSLQAAGLRTCTRRDPCAKGQRERRRQQQHAICKCKKTLDQDPNIHGIADPDLMSNQPDPTAATRLTAAASPATSGISMDPKPDSDSVHGPADGQRLRAISSPYHPIDASHYDLNLTHYKVPLLRYLSPPAVIGLGLAFIAAANAVEGGPSLSVTLGAAVPVLLWWFILLQVLPSVFKEFAVHYLETHDFVRDDQHKP